MSELSKGEIRALIGVLSFRDPNSTNLAFPSINTIAKRCGMTPSYCSKQLNRIAERGGILKINRRFNNSNTYDFVWTGCTPPVEGVREPPVHVPLPNRPSNRPLSVGEFLKQYPKPSPPSGGRATYGLMQLENGRTRDWKRLRIKYFWTYVTAYKESGATWSIGLTQLPTSSSSGGHNLWRVARQRTARHLTTNGRF